MEKLSLADRMLIEAGFIPRKLSKDRAAHPPVKKTDAHMDAEWITVNGTHIPLDDEGDAMAGGKLKGKNFSKAKSEKSESATSGSNGRSAKGITRASIETAPVGLCVYKNGTVYQKEDGYFVNLGTGEIVSADDLDGAGVAFNTAVQDHRATPVENGLSSDEVVDAIADQCYMTTEEAEAVRASLKKWTGSDYAKIRAAQRGSADSDDLKEAAERMEDFIARSPKFSGSRLYRGIAASDEEIQRIRDSVRNGTEYDQGGISSWTESEDVAHMFCEHNAKRGKSVIFKLSGTKQGTSIQPLTDDISEIVVSGRARFRNTDIDETGSVIIVTCEEVPVDVQEYVSGYFDM